MFIPSLLNLSGVVCLQTDRHESKRNKVKVNIQGKHLRRAVCAPMFPCICVGNDLSSRLVAKQVFSAQQSLTSVFGMGTGGPSALKSPTAVLPHGFIVSALTYLPGSSPSKYFRHCRA